MLREMGVEWNSALDLVKWELTRQQWKLSDGRCAKEEIESKQTSLGRGGGTYGASKVGVALPSDALSEGAIAPGSTRQRGSMNDTKN